MAKKSKPKEEIITPEHQAIAAIEAEPDIAQHVSQPVRPKFNLKTFLKTKKGKVISVILGAVIIVGVVLAIPFTRYALLGTAIKKTVTIGVFDITTGKPVSEAKVELAGFSVISDSSGSAKFDSVPVGDHPVKVTKNYYSESDQNIEVPIFGDSTATIKVQARGRQVPIKVINKISGKPINGAYIEAAGSSAKTNEDGEVAIVLSADQTTVEGNLKTAGYNDQKVQITVTDQNDEKNIFSILPTGKVYFLSKRTGKINVMKSNLDGTDTQIILEGTGKESDSDTILLASRNWRHLALKAKRDSDKPKLYYINTSTDQTSVIDEGDAEFTPVGWSNDDFIYNVDRNSVVPSQNGKFVLKGYNAQSNKLTTLDQSTAENGGYAYVYQTFTGTTIVNDLVFYIKEWHEYYGGYLLANKTNSMYTIKPSGQDKKELAKPGANNINFMQVKAYRPNELYISANPSNYNDKATYFEYEDGIIREDKEMTSDKFDKSYPIQLVSPSGQFTLWHEARGGKNSIFIGNSSGEQGKEVAKLEKQISYGWYSDEYVLMAKNGSELYIMSRDGGEPQKITDYHKAQFIGYGYGYGGSTDNLYY